MSGDGIINFWLEDFASQKFLRDFSARFGQEEPKELQIFLTSALSDYWARVGSWRSRMKSSGAAGESSTVRLDLYCRTTVRAGSVT